MKTMTTIALATVIAAASGFANLVSTGALEHAIASRMMKPTAIAEVLSFRLCIPVLLFPEFRMLIAAVVRRRLRRPGSRTCFDSRGTFQPA